jgi:hypothetical protein
MDWAEAILWMVVAASVGATLSVSVICFSLYAMMKYIIAEER